MMKAMKVAYFAMLVGAAGLLIVNTYGLVTDKLDGRVSTAMTMAIIALACGMVAVKRNIRDREKQMNIEKRRREREQREG